MAYNNGFPIGYQPAQIYYPQTPQTNVSPMMNNLPQPPQNTASSGIIWVQGEAGAKSYLVAPNTTVQLWDSESQTIYLKSADASGMPSMKTLDYTIREMQSPMNRIGQDRQIDLSKYVTWDELEEKLNSLKPKVKAKEKEVKSDE